MPTIQSGKIISIIRPPRFRPPPKDADKAEAAAAERGMKGEPERPKRGKPR